MALSAYSYVAMHTILWIPTFCVIAVRLPRLVMSIIYRWCNINRTRLNIHRLCLYIIGVCYYTTC